MKFVILLIVVSVWTLGQSFQIPNRYHKIVRYHKLKRLPSSETQRYASGKRFEEPKVNEWERDDAESQESRFQESKFEGRSEESHDDETSWKRNKPQIVNADEDDESNEEESEEDDFFESDSGTIWTPNNPQKSTRTQESKEDDRDAQESKNDPVVLGTGKCQCALFTTKGSHVSNPPVLTHLETPVSCAYGLRLCEKKCEFVVKKELVFIHEQLCQTLRIARSVQSHLYVKVCNASMTYSSELGPPICCNDGQLIECNDYDQFVHCDNETTINRPDNEISNEDNDSGTDPARLEMASKRLGISVFDKQAPPKDTEPMGNVNAWSERKEPKYSKDTKSADDDSNEILAMIDELKSDISQVQEDVLVLKNNQYKIGEILGVF